MVFPKCRSGYAHRPYLRVPPGAGGGQMPSGFGRMLSLHYYSNIAKDLLPTANEEVYPLYAIKDWNEISLHWVETFYQKENVRGMLNNFIVSGLEEYFLVCFGQTLLIICKRPADFLVWRTV